MAIPATEDFAGGAAALASPPWTQQRTAGTVNKNGSGVGIGSVGAKDLFAFWNADTFSPDQYAEMRIAGGLSSGAQYAQLLVRASGTGDANYNNYVFTTDGGSGSTHTEVNRNVNGVQTIMANFTTTFTTGDRMRIEARGNRLYCFKNGVLLAPSTGGTSVVDNTHSSGSPGVGMFGTSVTIDDFVGGQILYPVLSVNRPTLLCGPWRTQRCPFPSYVPADTPTAPPPGTITIEPGVGDLVLDGFAPTIGLPVTVVTQIAQLDLAGFAPKFPTTIVTQIASLTLTGFAPTVGLPKTIVSGLGALTLTGFSPQFAKTVVPGTGALSLTGFAPTFARTVVSGLGALTLDGFAPAFTFISGGFTLQPGLGALSLTGFSPAIGLPRTLRPDVGSLTLSGFAPAIGVPYTLRPGFGQLTLTGFGPAISVTPLGLFITPGTGQLVLTGYAPQFGSFTFRFAGGPVMVATITAGGVLVASITGGPVLTGTFDGDPV